MASKRLIKELEQYSRDLSPAVSRLEAVGDDLTHLTADLRGSEGTAYEGRAAATYASVGTKR